MKIHVNDYKQIPYGKSGIYMFQDESGKILYIGKANDIRQRMCNYFGESNYWSHLEKYHDNFETIIIAFVSKERTKFIEKNLIIFYKPPLNIQYNKKFTERDEKDYFKDISEEDMKKAFEKFWES
jgi:excinuclease UvrABC nuclease subunit